VITGVVALLVAPRFAAVIDVVILLKTGKLKW
jgi:hypothetical protein